MAGTCPVGVCHHSVSLWLQAKLTTQIPASCHYHRHRHRHCTKCQNTFFSAASHLPLLQLPGRRAGHLFIRQPFALCVFVLSSDTRLEWKVPTQCGRRRGVMRKSVHGTLNWSDVESTDTKVSKVQPWSSVLSDAINSNGV